MNIYNTHTLANGLRIIHLYQESEVVYCGYAIKGGTRNEATAKDGLAHFCEHLTFKGTVHLSPLQIINSIERYGGELNAYTAKEETIYYAAILRRYFIKAVDTLTDIVFHSTYPQSEIDKECEVVCEEIDCYYDNPAELIYDDFENNILCGHALGHNVLGTKENVRNFTTNDCLDFVKQWYIPNNMIFYVCGDINFSMLVKRLENMLANYPASVPTVKEITDISHICAQTNIDLSANGIKLPKEQCIVDNSRQTHQAHVMHGLAFTCNLKYWHFPLFVLNNILGGYSMNSRFNISLREKRGLVYTVESAMTTYSDVTLWNTYYGCAENDIKKCSKLIFSQLEKLRQHPISNSRLDSAKRQIKGQIALSHQQKESFAIEMAKQYLHKGILYDDAHLYSMIDNVKSQDISLLADHIMNKDNLFTLIYT